MNDNVERRPGHMTLVMQSAGSSAALDTIAVSQCVEEPRIETRASKVCIRSPKPKCPRPRLATVVCRLVVLNDNPPRVSLRTPGYPSSVGVSRI